MNSKFECFVQIKDKKYGLVLNTNSISAIFVDIYPKIQQIVKIDLKEDIYFSTHEFEIFEDLSTECVVIEELSQSVRHKSVIRVKQKERIDSLSAVNPITTASTEPHRTQPEVQLTHPLSTESVRNQENPLNVLGWRPQREISSNDCPIDSINCDEVSDGSVKTEAQTTQPLSQLTDSTTIDNRCHPNPFNPRKGKQKRPQNQTFEECVVTLECRSKHIKRFHEIVANINIGWNFKGTDSIKYWRKLSHHMRYSCPQFYVNEYLCRGAFGHWTQFYVKNYDKLNGNVKPELQKTFDLLKIVHILDLSQFFSPTDPTFVKIRDISLMEDFRDYFNKNLVDLRNQKILTKEGYHQMSGFQNFSKFYKLEASDQKVANN